ncbi:MAG: alpha/beta hydrolase [Phycisphaeraceae bacterium]|nr:alpha/beta hydrolase [Phycisphaeraceae bacterium]MCW5763809.1 alpha/beta hydrolase [Phycisphaeraceae bacterium]
MSGQEAGLSAIPKTTQDQITAEDVRHLQVPLRGMREEPIIGRVAQTGVGLPVVFLHGLVGLNEHWEGVVERVKHRFSCTTLELPLLSLDGPDCSIQSVTDLTIQFLKKFMKQPVVLVGNSFGGHVALRVALKRKALVRGLVLAGSSGLFERTFVKGAPVRPSREWLVEKIGELFHDRSFMSLADVDRAHAALSAKGGARAMVRLSRSARRNHLGDHIGQIAAPTLLIWGRNDIVTPPSAAQGFADLIPGSELFWIDRCGHAPMIEAPAEFARAMLDFADRFSPPTRHESDEH